MRASASIQNQSNKVDAINNKSKAGTRVVFGHHQNGYQTMNTELITQPGAENYSSNKDLQRKQMALQQQGHSFRMSYDEATMATSESNKQTT